MTAQLLPIEKDVLRACNGEEVPGLAWGAAMSVCLEYLEAGGWLETRDRDGGVAYELTAKGREAIQ